MDKRRALFIVSGEGGGLPWSGPMAGPSERVHLLDKRATIARRSARLALSRAENGCLTASIKGNYVDQVGVNHKPAKMELPTKVTAWQHEQFKKCRKPTIAREAVRGTRTSLGTGTRLPWNCIHVFKPAQARHVLALTSTDLGVAIKCERLSTLAPRR